MMNRFLLISAMSCCLTMVASNSYSNEYSNLSCPELEVEFANTQAEIEILTKEINEAESQLRHSNPYGRLNDVTASVNHGFAQGKIQGTQRKRSKLTKSAAQMRKAALVVCNQSSTQSQHAIDPKLQD